MNILVVDDNRVNAALYRQVLSAIPDAATFCFSDPFAALKWCRAQTPDLLIVDYRMPGIDGIQFMRAFHKLRGTASVPIIMLTAVASPVLWQMAIDAGAAAFFLKPIDKTRFLASVQMLVHKMPPPFVKQVAVT